MKPLYQYNVSIPACFDQLYRYLARFGVIEEFDRSKVRDFCIPQHFQKDVLLYRAGDIPRNIFFIGSGVVRYYCTAEDGKEYNQSFARDNQMAGALYSSFLPEASRFSIQALTPVQTLAIRLKELNSLFQRSLVWANFGRLYMESVAIKKTRQEAELFLDSASERYRSLMNQDPELARRLPLRHIASYIGITDVGLLARISKRRHR